MCVSVVYSGSGRGVCFSCVFVCGSGLEVAVVVVFVSLVCVCVCVCVWQWFAVIVVFVSRVCCVCLSSGGGVADSGNGDDVGRIL